jgi:Family of unknown function (DUF6011)
MYSLATIKETFNTVFGDLPDVWASFEMHLESSPHHNKQQETVKPPPNVGSYHFPNIYKMAMEKGVRLHLDGCKIHLSMAGILSVINPVYGQGYYGKFDSNGNFKPTKECTDAVLSQLKDVEINGVEAAKRIGLLTGTCCVCGRSLTNEGSIEAGIGPICAGKF